MRLSYRVLPAAYRAYKEVSLLLALAVPPRRYYQLREWYAAHGLRRLRRAFGEPQPRGQFIERSLAANRTGDRNVSLSNLPGVQ
jgi:hypothetical protein